MVANDLASYLYVVWRILEKYSIPPEPLFRKAEIDPALIRQSGKRCPSSKASRLWSLTAEAIDDPCFGLLAADCWHPSDHGAMGYAVLSSKTLKEASDRIIRYNRMLSTEEFVRCDDQAEGLVITLVGSEERRHLPARNDAALAVLLSSCRLNYQQEFAPLSVTLTHPQPACSARYYQFFGCPVTFEAEQNTMILPIDIMEKELYGSNPQLTTLHDQVIQDYLAELNTDALIHRIKTLITDKLPSGNVPEKQVAGELYMGVRNMQRLLQEQGTSFVTLLNEVRRDLAITYVRDKDFSFTEVAFLIGFADSSTFSRAFKRWTGQSPRNYKKAGVPSEDGT